MYVSVEEVPHIWIHKIEISAAPFARTMFHFPDSVTLSLRFALAHNRPETRRRELARAARELHASFPLRCIPP